MLQEGIKAPDFVLKNQNGNSVALSDFVGRKVILYFYSKDHTTGCTRQALGFAEIYAAFQELGAEVIGVSKDSVASHQKFAEKYALPFVLLSDPELQVMQSYDVCKEKRTNGKVSTAVLRTTYLIDESGVITKAMPKVKPDTNAAEILEYLHTR